MELQIYMMPIVTEALGPFKRCALWVQGCMKQCPGCISPDAQPLAGGITVDVNELAKEIEHFTGIEGITISGGEPFLQQDGLCELIKLVRKQRDIGIIVYTGMLYSEISNTTLAQCCDLIIDGEYIEELNDDRSLRGSSNQSAICITDRYLGIIDSYFGQSGRSIEVRLTETGMQIVGIPIKQVRDMLINYARD